LAWNGPERHIFPLLDIGARPPSLKASSRRSCLPPAFVEHLADRDGCPSRRLSLVRSRAACHGPKLGNSAFGGFNWPRGRRTFVPADHDGGEAPLYADRICIPVRHAADWTCREHEPTLVAAPLTNRNRVAGNRESANASLRWVDRHHLASAHSWLSRSSGLSAKHSLIRARCGPHLRPQRHERLSLAPQRPGVSPGIQPPICLKLLPNEYRATYLADGRRRREGPTAPCREHAMVIFWIGKSYEPRRSMKEPGVDRWDEALNSPSKHRHAGACPGHPSSYPKRLIAGSSRGMIQRHLTACWDRTSF